MKKKFLLYILIFVTLLTAIGVNVYGRARPNALISLQPVLPRDNFFNTIDIAPEVRGFGGHIEMLVELDKESHIKDIEVLSHNETSQYAVGITGPEFLDQFKGKDVRDEFIVGKDIDGITQATISSKAVARTLKASLERIDGQAKGFYEIPPRFAPRDGWSENFPTIHFYITVLIITFLLIAFYLKNNWLRSAGLFISIVYFGFIKANFISMSNLGGIFLWNLPDLRPNITWYVFISSALLLTFLFGSFYCSYMCPFGGLQIFLNKIFKFNLEISTTLANRLRKIRYFLLWIFIILVLVLNNANVVNYEPFPTVFLRRGSLVAWSIASIVLILSLFHSRPFCNYFCAAGAFLNILSGLGKGIFRKR